MVVTAPPKKPSTIDITHTDIDQPALYAAMGVKEFWRYDGELLRIYLLQDGTYQEQSASETFPQIKKEQLYRFIAECEQDEVEASLSFRQWVRDIA